MFRAARSTAEVWVENLEVRYQDRALPPLLDEEFSLQPLISETFDRYALGSFPGKGGWRVNQVSLDTAPGKEAELAAVEKPEPVASLKSFKLKASAESDIPVIKTITLPAQIPYDVSARGFAVVTEATIVRTAGNVARTVSGQGGTSGHATLKDVRRGGLPSGSRNPDSLGRTPDATKPNGSGSTGRTKTMSAGTAANYYLYSFDGRLLAEYDVYGACQKDYIYMGSRLIAEYNPTSMQYHYYMQDQIRSTKVVTDDTGTRVWAEAYDPYGGIQYTWASNTFTPERKFSDKERDQETGLDYFGARYYDSGSFRWLSADPSLIRRDDPNPPCSWNLYSFCRNSPATNIDPDGRVVISLTIDMRLVPHEDIQSWTRNRSRGGAFLVEYEIKYKKTLYEDGNWHIEVIISAPVMILIPEAGDPVYGFQESDPKNMGEAMSHEICHLDDFLSALEAADRAALKLESKWYDSLRSLDTAIKKFEGAVSEAMAVRAVSSIGWDYILPKGLAYPTDHHIR